MINDMTIAIINCGTPEFTNLALYSAYKNIKCNHQHFLIINSYCGRKENEQFELNDINKSLNLDIDIHDFNSVQLRPVINVQLKLLKPIKYYYHNNIERFLNKKLDINQIINANDSNISVCDCGDAIVEYYLNYILNNAKYDDVVFMDSDAVIMNEIDFSTYNTDLVGTDDGLSKFTKKSRISSELIYFKRSKLNQFGLKFFDLSNYQAYIQDGYFVNRYHNNNNNNIVMHFQALQIFYQELCRLKFNFKLIDFKTKFRQYVHHFGGGTWNKSQDKQIYKPIFIDSHWDTLLK